MTLSLLQLITMPFVLSASVCLVRDAARQLVSASREDRS
jgi:hypothetical protein